MSSEYALIHRAGKLPDKANKFITFIRSAQGRGIIETAGMVAL